MKYTGCRFIKDFDLGVYSLVVIWGRDLSIWIMDQDISNYSIMILILKYLPWKL